MGESNERDDLSMLIYSALESHEHRDAAEAVIAAGWVSPATLALARSAILEELADLLEPFSGIGLANGATRAEIAIWVRAHARDAK